MDINHNKNNSTFQINDKLSALLTHNYKFDISNYLYANPELFEDLFELALQEHPKLSWRAAWAFYDFINSKKHIVEENQHRIFKILPFREENHQRELLKLIDEIEIDENYIALAFDECLKLWVQLYKKPSVRYNAFKIMLKLANKYTIFQNEFIFYTSSKYIESLSPGAKHSINKLLKNLSFINDENFDINDFDF